MNNKNCQLCKNYKDGFCKELELKPVYPEKGCDYFRDAEHYRNAKTGGWNVITKHPMDADEEEDENGGNE